MAFKLPALPFAPEALAPHISAETIQFHYGKHHQAYVDKLNKLLEDSPLRDASLEEIVKKSSGGLFNNAAQAWNHTFYWHCLSEGASRHQPAGSLEGALKDSFGGLDPFLEKFIQSAIDNFGSGWTWLVKDKAHKLSILNTANADTPIKNDIVPLLVADVWEHAYYIDYRNDRKKHLTALKNILHWNFASERFESDQVFNVTREMR